MFPGLDVSASFLVSPAGLLEAAEDGECDVAPLLAPGLLFEDVKLCILAIPEESFEFEGPGAFFALLSLTPGGLRPLVMVLGLLTLANLLVARLVVLTATAGLERGLEALLDAGLPDMLPAWLEVRLLAGLPVTQPGFLAGRAEGLLAWLAGRPPLCLVPLAGPEDWAG